MVMHQLPAAVQTLSSMRESKQEVLYRRANARNWTRKQSEVRTSQDPGGTELYRLYYQVRFNLSLNICHTFRCCSFRCYCEKERSVLTSTVFLCSCSCSCCYSLRGEKQRLKDTKHDEHDFHVMILHTSTSLLLKYRTFTLFI